MIRKFNPRHSVTTVSGQRFRNNGKDFVAMVMQPTDLVCWNNLEPWRDMIIAENFSACDKLWQLFKGSGYSPLFLLHLKPVNIPMQ